MIPMIVLVLAACGLAHGSGLGHIHSLAPVGAAPVAVAPAPVVAAHSSQYFERTFNRLVAALLVPEPVFPVQHVVPSPPVAHVHPVAPPPQVFVEPVTRTVPVPVNPTQNVPTDPNVAIAIATAHAAPVATILLPPYPFAPPPTFGFVPQVLVPEQRNETATQPQSNTVPTTTVREPEQTTPLPQQPQQPQPSNTDNNFAQAPTSNQNPNFQIQQTYGPPFNVQPLPKPQKLKTSVEVVPVPLRYIAPPPIPHHHHHHHHHHHGHPVRYVHSFVPAKLIVRPVHVHAVKLPAKLVVHKVPVKKAVRSQQNVLRPRIDNARDVEPTTFKPFRPVTKPPRL